MTQPSPTTAVPPLSREDIDSFVDRGFCTLRRAFTAEQAAAARVDLWAHLSEHSGIRREAPKTWPPGPFNTGERINTPAVQDTFTERLALAIGQLLGHENWAGHRLWGAWPMNFPASHENAGWWHLDGDWRDYRPNALPFGVLVIGLFTDIAPRFGGTLLSLGSELRAADTLRDHPGGIDRLALREAVLKTPLEGPVHEITGRAGDVYLVHPMVFHTTGTNFDGPPRIINNTVARLKGVIDLEAEKPTPLVRSMLRIRTQI